MTQDIEESSVELQPASPKKEIREDNHQVPKGLLKWWCNKEGNKFGINAFKILEQKKIHAQGKKASFAVQKFLYVPENENCQRDDSLEVEFSKGESDLTRFIDATVRGNHNNIADATAQNVIRTCIALAYRSVYYSSRAAMLGMGSDKEVREIHRNVIRQTKETINYRRKSLENWQYKVITNLGEDLLINDTPFVDLPMQKEPKNFVSMALHPRILLCGIPSPENKFNIAWVDAKNSAIGVSDYNQWSIDTARSFVVAKTVAQLDKVIPNLSKEKVSERMGRDRVVGYTIKKRDDVP